jgi:hypothetical protein
MPGPAIFVARQMVCDLVITAVKAGRLLRLVQHT